MKITLPERSLIIQNRLNEIIKEILLVAERKLAMIILFGSYARGDWVQDEYKLGHITYSYQSDFDIMLVLKKGRYLSHQEMRIEEKIEKRLERKLLMNPFSKDPWVTLVLESIDTVNKQLEKGHYFYSDIIKEGILLYDSGEFQLAEAKKLSLDKQREIAKEDYEQWYARGAGFLMDSQSPLKSGDFPLSAFYLHQATESFYTAILLVFSGYKPKLHDILKLGMMARNYHPDLFKIFPYASPEQIECFKLLRKAYVEARYNKNFNLNKEQLLYLIERVEQLKIITEKICLEWINKELY